MLHLDPLLLILSYMLLSTIPHSSSQPYNSLDGINVLNGSLAQLMIKIFIFCTYVVNKSREGSFVSLSQLCYFYIFQSIHISVMTITLFQVVFGIDFKIQIFSLFSLFCYYSIFFVTIHRFYYTFQYYLWISMYYFNYLLTLFIIFLAKKISVLANKLFPNGLLV